MNASNNLATAIKSHETGQLGEAEKLYREVLREQPANTIALSNLGIIANQVGKHAAAADLLRKSLSLKPDHPATLLQLGNALNAMQKKNEALACYKRVLQLKPDYAEAYYNIAIEITRRGQGEKAMELLEKAISLKPSYPEAYNVLGNLYDKQGKIKQAIDSYNTSIRLRPSYALAHNNMGNTLLNAGMAEKALECYRRAIKHKPDFVEALFNMGGALELLGRTQEAINAFSRVLKIKPDLPEARFNLTRTLQKACDWRDPRASADEFANYLAKHPGHVDPFFLLSQNSSHADQLLCAQHFAKRSAVPPQHVFAHEPGPKTKRKIRIGYISGNFHQHPNSFLSVGLFEHHDRSKFEVFGYSYGIDDKSQTRKRVEKSFDHFVNLRMMTHLDAAKKIHADGIDILIDRQGYTTQHRMQIAAYRPAPIQVNFLGYPGTMGSEAIDYIIADKYVVPTDQQPYFTEQLVHLPHCYQSTDNKQQVPEHTPLRSECGLPEDGVVFCCFNNTNKIQPQFFDIWMRILAAVPGSVLWLLNKNKLVQENLQREAQARGIDPARLVFAPPAEHGQHLARQRLADLFLDTLPYNAHTTASDALWVGLPVLTCLGNTFSGRVAASILHAIDMPELITESLADYEKLAIKLAKQPKQIAKLKKKLAANRLSTPLFDTALYTQNIEKAYLAMWKRWQAGKPAQQILLD